MTSQTLSTRTNPNAIVQDSEPAAPPSPKSPRSRRFRGAIATGVVAGLALIALGLTSQIRADDAPTLVPQRATDADLRLAAESARRMETLAPELARVSPRPASYIDLRLAAEWARRLETLSPS